METCYFLPKNFRLAINKVYFLPKIHPEFQMDLTLKTNYDQNMTKAIYMTQTHFQAWLNIVNANSIYLRINSLLLMYFNHSKFSIVFTDDPNVSLTDLLQLYHSYEK